MKKYCQLLYLVGVFTLFLPSFAFAYIDPGTGSIILQAPQPQHFQLWHFGAL